MGHDWCTCGGELRTWGSHWKGLGEVAAGASTACGARAAGILSDGGGGGVLAGMGSGVIGLSGLGGSVWSCLRLSSMFSRCCCIRTGRYFLRNLRLHRVIQPEPSTRRHTD